MTAGERLVQLAGAGTAGALLLLIGAGATAGAALVNYSQLESATAAEHLLTDIPPAQTVHYGGWPTYKKKTAKQIEQERIALGILPKEVAQIVAKVARKAIKKATEQHVPDVMTWAMQDAQQAIYERQLRMELSRHKQMWDRAYGRIFEIALQEALIAEESAIVMLLMEL